MHCAKSAVTAVQIADGTAESVRCGCVTLESTQEIASYGGTHRECKDTLNHDLPTIVTNPLLFITTLSLLMY